MNMLLESAIRIKNSRIFSYISFVVFVCDVPWYSSLFGSVLVFDKGDATSSHAKKVKRVCDVCRVSHRVRKLCGKIVGSFGLVRVKERPLVVRARKSRGKTAVHTM
jgi:hypothetical protein